MRKHNRLLLSLMLLGTLSAGCLPAPAGKDTGRDQAAGYARQAQELWTKAAGLYEGLVRQSPGDRQLSFELGLVYFHKGDYAAAVPPLRHAGPGAAGYLGRALYHLGAYTDALAVFKTAAPGDDETDYYHAQTCAELNLYDQALALYRAIPPSSRWAPEANKRLEQIERKRGGKLIGQADPFAARLIAAAPSGKDYPQAGGLILWCDEREEVSADNRSVTTVRYLVKILNERGKEQYAEMPIEYDSTFEKVELIYARTIKPDGEIVDVGERHLRDVSKYMNFPLYSNARVLLISFPEVVAGAVIEYQAKITCNQLLNKTDFVLPYTVQSADPILRCRFELQVPAAKQIAIKTFNARYNDFKAQLKPRQSSAGPTTSYLWEFENVPQVIPEPNMPPAVEVNPGFIVSSFSGWQSIYSWWWGLAKDKIKADAAIAAEVKGLISRARTDAQKAAAIHHYCAQKIRYVAVEYGDAGYEPHQAADIYKNKYGDCKDQAILLVTMLRQAGLKSWPVLIGTREHFNLDPDFPAVLFNHAIACVELEGKPVFLDPTAETCAFGDLPLDDQQRQVLVIKDDGFAIALTPGFALEHNLVKQTTEITVKDDQSIRGEKRVESFGVYDQGQRYWLLYTMPETVKDTIAGNLQAISIGSRLSEYRTSDVSDLSLPVTLRYEFSGKEFFTSAGDLRILPQIGNLELSQAAKDTRRYPLDFGFAGIQQIETSVNLPPGQARVFYLPAAVSEKSPWLDLDVTYLSRGRTLTISQRIATKQRQVPAEDYPVFKAFLEKASTLLKQRIVLKEN